VQF
jgi:hypothetical protein